MRPKQLLSSLLGILLVGSAIALLALGDTRPAESGSPQANSKVPRVRVSTAETIGTGIQPLRFPGVTRARQRARLAFRVPGRIVERSVEIGDRVSAGSLLARIEAPEHTHAVAGAAAELARADERLAQLERDLLRANQLARAQAITHEEHEQAGSAVSASRAARDAAAARLDETRRLQEEQLLRSPFAGTVRRVSFEAGELVQEGEIVIEIDGENGQELEIEVPETLIGHLVLGQELRVELPLSPTESIRGRVVSLARSAGGPGALFPVLIALEDAPELRPGTSAELLLEAQASDTLWLPVEALMNPGGEEHTVFVLRGDRVERIPLTPGRVSGARVAVQSTLRRGDRVVVAGHQNLLNGDLVVVIP